MLCLLISLSCFHPSLFRASVQDQILLMTSGSTVFEATDLITVKHFYFIYRVTEMFVLFLCMAFCFGFPLFNLISWCVFDSPQSMDVFCHFNWKSWWLCKWTFESIRLPCLSLSLFFFFFFFLCFFGYCFFFFLSCFRLRLVFVYVLITLLHFGKI